MQANDARERARMMFSTTENKFNRLVQTIKNTKALSNGEVGKANGTFVEFNWQGFSLQLRLERVSEGPRKADFGFRKDFEERLNEYLSFILYSQTHGMDAMGHAIKDKLDEVVVEYSKSHKFVVGFGFSRMPLVRDEESERLVDNIVKLAVLMMELDENEKVGDDLLGQKHIDDVYKSFENEPLIHLIKYKKDQMKILFGNSCSMEIFIEDTMMLRLTDLNANNSWIRQFVIDKIRGCVGCEKYIGAAISGATKVYGINVKVDIKEIKGTEINLYVDRLADFILAVLRGEQINSELRKMSKESNDNYSYVENVNNTKSLKSFATETLILACEKATKMVDDIEFSNFGLEQLQEDLKEIRKYLGIERSYIMELVVYDLLMQYKDKDFISVNTYGSNYFVSIHESFKTFAKILVNELSE